MGVPAERAPPPPPSPQGGLLDNVEQYVMHTAEHVERANREAKKALQYRGQARKVGGCRRPWVLSACLSPVPPPFSVSLRLAAPRAP